MPPDPEARRDLLSAAGLAALAVAYLLLNRRYPLDTLATPGPGVFPLAVGVLVLVLAGCLAGGSKNMGGRDGPPKPPNARSAPAKPGRSSTSRRFPFAMIGVLVAWAAIVPVAGFFAPSAVLVAVSARLMGATGWRGPVALALGVTAAAYVLFVRWLGVPLPGGLFW